MLVGGEMLLYSVDSLLEQRTTTDQAAPTTPAKDLFPLTCQETGPYWNLNKLNINIYTW